jgi:hypothetical protein
VVIDLATATSLICQAAIALEVSTVYRFRSFPWDKLLKSKRNQRG